MKIELEKIGVNKWRIKKLPGMKADAVIYARESLLREAERDLSLEQLTDAASLPRVISPVIGMPDIHEGFGLPIGGVMATDGLVSVGAVGMDINCGVRLLKSQLKYDEKKFSQERLRQLIGEIVRWIPIGLGGERRKHPLDLNQKEIVEKGVFYLKEKGMASDADIESTEESGRLAGANFASLTERAKQRAINQVGTLGSGNHFMEIQKLTEIFDEKIAEAFGLFKNQICVMIHCGSRALGHQTCVDYTELFWKMERKYKIDVLRKGLAALPVDVPEGKKYFEAMAASVNFAFCNRQVITYFVREVFERVFGFEGKLDLVYDVAHNIAKWEEHREKRILVHRKGATRALPAGHKQNPKKYMDTGHPAIVPGSMGTASYVMVGLPKNEETFDSINHGAGRLMSRGAAKRSISKNDFEASMRKVVYNMPFYKILDEAPGAYKNIEDVVETLVEAGLTKKVVRLEPLAVIKGD